MDKTEFDKFAQEYESLHAQNIARFGELPDYFTNYKIVDLADEIQQARIDARSMLDFGAGVGNSVPFVVRWLPGVALTCADVSRVSLDIARNRNACDGVKYAEIDELELPFADGSFDVIFSACAFHHIPASEHALWLSELRRVTRPGGMVLIYEHNPLNPMTRSTVRDCAFDENAVLIRAGDLGARLKATGWTQVRTAYRVFFPAWLAFARPLEHLLTGLPLGAQYYATARR